MEHEPHPANQSAAAGLSRRQFLKVSLLAIAAGAAACAPGSEPGWQREATRWVTPTPEQALPSPPAPAEAVEPPQHLESFLALSALLTGVENLNPRLGAAYLQALQESPDTSAGLNGLLERAGYLDDAPPETLDALEQTGIFEQEDTGAAANRILEVWYTGIVGGEDDQRVITFTDSLAWKSLTFTKPVTICGAFGFWATRPEGEY